MAKKNELNYASELRTLKERGPERLYFIWGPEDYLCEQYLLELKKICVPDGEDGFSCRRINGPSLDAAKLREAVDAMPFFTERSFVELRGVDINRLENADDCLGILGDIPEHCTVAFIQSAKFEPDGRLKFVKGLRGICRELKFTQQSPGLLTGWIARRFAAFDKGIELDAAQRLIFISGDLMNRLIPEIEKIASYAKGDKVTTADVEAVASHIPEAVVFEMTELMAQKKYNSALSVLAELLSDKNNEPIMIAAVLGAQMKKLYAARLAADNGLGSKYVMEVCSIKYDYIASKLMSAAKSFTLPQLIRAVELCGEADYKMKSSALDAKELLKEVVLRIAVGETDVQS